MQFREAVGLLPLGKQRQRGALVDNVVFVMQEFGYTIEEIGKMPVPSFLTILEVFMP